MAKRAGVIEIKRNQSLSSLAQDVPKGTLSPVRPTYQASAARVERSEIRVCFKPLLGSQLSICPIFRSATQVGDRDDFDLIIGNLAVDDSIWEAFGMC